MRPGIGKQGRVFRIRTGRDNVDQLRFADRLDEAQAARKPVLAYQEPDPA
jgi:hypothetical protein